MLSKCRVIENEPNKKENLWIKEWVAFIRKEKNNLNLFETDKTDFPGLLLHILNIILITSYNASAAYKQYVEVVLYLCGFFMQQITLQTYRIMYVQKTGFGMFYSGEIHLPQPIYAVINSVYYSDQL